MFTAIQQDGRRPGRTLAVHRPSFLNGYLTMPPPVAAQNPSLDSPSVSKTVRHRGQPAAILVVRGVALTSYRLALMGALALLAVASTVLRALS